MMPRYIDAEGLNLYDDLFMKGKNDSGVWVRYRDVERLIRNAPTADVEEARHGYWVKQHVSQELCGVEYYRCSLCNREEQYKPPYCHCGAKMDGKEKTDDEL